MDAALAAVGDVFLSTISILLGKVRGPLTDLGGLRSINVPELNQRSCSGLFAGRFTLCHAQSPPRNQLVVPLLFHRHERFTRLAVTISVGAFIPEKVGDKSVLDRSEVDVEHRANIGSSNTASFEVRDAID